jgi:hypothetical protein
MPSVNDVTGIYKSYYQIVFDDGTFEVTPEVYALNEMDAWILLNYWYVHHRGVDPIDNFTVPHENIHHLHQVTEQI